MAADTIHGVVDKDGNIVSGTGFEVHKVDHISFRVIFERPFMEPPAVVATLYSTNINNAYYETDQYSRESQGCIVSGLEGAPLTVYGFSVFYQEEVGFNFIAMGELE